MELLDSWRTTDLKNHPDGVSIQTPLSIVHVEDTLSDAALLEAILEIEKIPCNITVVKSRHELQAALNLPELHLILSDFSMPRFDGLSALMMSKKQRPEVPFIFVSGTIGEELAIEALREGATDYVLKDRMARLPAAIRRALADVEAKKQKQRNEEKLRDQATLLDLAQDAICLINMEQAILYWNKSAERVYGWTAEEALNSNANELLFKKDLNAPCAALKILMQTGKWQGELHQVTKDGQQIIVESRWTLMRDGNGEPKSILIINTDVTERKQIEAQFLRTQRMETIGALAGGIAHDLNNSLTPVMMALSFMRNEATSEECKKFLALAQASGQRSIEMVKQILSFSRGVGGEHAPLQLQHLINEVVKFAEDTFPRTIQIVNKTGTGLAPINGNATQLHQVLLNLCVNARDAMPNGGSIHIEASNIVLQEMDLQLQRVTPGPYVLLTVSDTGHGMPPQILAKIFDPFFTTKEIGKGTGLGLSTVMGIVKTHGGFVEVSSEAGKGSLFRVFLPVARN